jgi:hypothetical protein
MAQIVHIGWRYINRFSRVKKTLGSEFFSVGINIRVSVKDEISALNHLVFYISDLLIALKSVDLVSRTFASL